MPIPYDFFQQVERKLKYVLYGDTDSIYINIPQIKPKDSSEAFEKAKEISTDINKYIKSYMDSILLPKMGIDKVYNYTEFKTELVADAMLLLDIKKNYAYRMLVDEGKILQTPVVKYTNLSVKKSDVPKFTKEFITRIVEDILFNSELDKTSFRTKIMELTIEMRNRLKHLLDTFEYSDISIPKKWGLDYKAAPFQIQSMKLYNTLLNKNIFKPMSAGLILPLKILNYNDLESKLSTIRNNSDFFIKDIPIIKITKIAIPYNYEKSVIEQIFKFYNINIDIDECWNIIFNKILQRIIEVSKII